jgi:hypothetical protein
VKDEKRASASLFINYFIKCQSIISHIIKYTVEKIGVLPFIKENASQQSGRSDCAFSF